MTNCPKCGTEKSMRGPKYVADEKGERLVTRCRVCKYTVEMPCADAKSESESKQRTGRLTIEMSPGEEPAK
jgi:hypothetical protein